MNDKFEDLFDNDELNPDEIRELINEGSELLEGEESVIFASEADEISEQYQESEGDEIEPLSSEDEFFAEEDFEGAESVLLQGEAAEEILEKTGDADLFSPKMAGSTTENELEDPELAALKERIKKRRIERQQKLNKRNRLIGFLVAIAVLFALSFTKIVHVDRIVVRGNSYFKDSEIIAMSHAKMGNNLIYKPGKAKIKSYLQTNPYIESVKVRRRLPSTLVIVIKEREQLVAIPYSDEFIVTDAEKTVLRRTTDIPQLTIIEGVKIKKMKVGEKLEAENKDLLDSSYEFLELMKKHEMFFKKIVVDGDNTRIYIFDNLVCIGATNDIKKMIEKNRMQEILKNLMDRGVKRGKILVSENGYASYTPNL